MDEFEGFDTILSGLTLAKALYDIGRFDIVERHFFDELHWEDYYHNMLAAISYVFAVHESDYNENDDVEIMSFEDKVISDYFVYAWEYGKKHNIHYSQNPYVSLAHKEVERWLYVSNCSSWKLSAHIRSKESAKKSRIFVYHDTSCGCTAHENIAYGLIQLYAWFVSKNAEFENKENAIVPFVPDASTKTEYLEVAAA